MRSLIFLILMLESVAPARHRIAAEQARPVPLPANGPASSSSRVRCDSSWPHLRGPRYNGTARVENMVDSIPGDGLPVVWRRELGQGYSGIIAEGNRIYTQYQVGTDQYVICLSAETGETLWRHRYGWAWDADGSYPGPRATPAWWEGRIYFVGAYTNMGCLDARTGQEEWSFNLNDAFEGKGTEFGYSATPSVEAEQVFLPVGGAGASVVALSTGGGMTLWQSGDDPASYCGSLPITFRHRRLIVSLLQNALVIHDPTTGKEVCRNTVSTGYDEHAVWPLYQEPFLVVASAFKKGSRILKLERSSDGEIKLPLVRECRQLSCDVFTPVLVDGYIYGFDLHDIQANAKKPSEGLFKCISLQTGEVQWETNRTGHCGVSAIRSEQGTLLLLYNDTGELILAEANPSRYQELGRMKVFTGGIFWTPPAISSGRLFSRNHEEAVCLLLRKKPGPRRMATAGRNNRKRLPSQHKRQRVSGKKNPWNADALVAPSFKDMFRWWAACLLVGLALPALMVGAFNYVLQKHCPVVFLLLSALAGLAGTHVLTAAFSKFIFTWPVTLFAIFMAVVRVGLKPGPSGLKSRGALVLLAAACLEYFYICKASSVIMGWGFLVGFVPAFPLAISCGKSASAGRPGRGVLWWYFATFSVFFLGGAVFTVLRTHS